MAGKKLGLALLIICLLASAAAPGAAATFSTEKDEFNVDPIVGMVLRYVPAVYSVCVDPLVCNGVSDDPGCRVAAISGTDPAISTDPVLGIVAIDPDGCYFFGGLVLPGFAPLHMTSEAR